MVSSRQAFRASILPEAAADVEAGTCKQKVLSALIDAKAETDLKQHHSADPSYQAHLALHSLHGAGAWLTATPSDDARTMDPILFQIAVKRRLRIRVQSQDTFCPMCGDTMDSYGDHALVCTCRGEPYCAAQ